MTRNTDEDWSEVNPVHLVNPVYLGFISLICLTIVWTKNEERASQKRR